MTKPPTISYLRNGRHLRASGTIVDHGTGSTVGLTKVKPCRREWACVWLTPGEIEAGKDKPEYHPRPVAPDAEKKPRKKRGPKAPAIPRWQELVAHVRLMQAGGTLADFDPRKTLALFIEFADQLDSAHAQLSQFLPLKP